MAWRKEPGPLSLVLVARKVESTTRGSSNSMAGRNNLRRNLGLNPAAFRLVCRFVTNLCSPGNTIWHLLVPKDQRGETCCRLHELSVRHSALMIHEEIKDVLRRTPERAADIANHQRLQTDV